MASPFRFRLERLLELRRAKEAVARRAFAEASRAAREEAARLAAIGAEEEALKGMSRNARTGALDLTALRLAEGYLGALERRARAARERLAELSRAEAEKRRALAEAVRGVKALERFRARKLAEWSRAADREEVRVLDEAAAARREGA